MKGLEELLRLMRYAHATLAVRHYQRDIERSKHGLAKAYVALDKASADLRIFEAALAAPTPPAYLLKGLADDGRANVEPIKLRRTFKRRDE